MPLGLAHYHERNSAGYERCRETECGRPQLDRWLCTKRTKVRNEPRYVSCGNEYFYRRRTPYKVGGPRTRTLDPRYAYGYQYKCKHPHENVLLRHESAPDPEQPTQDPMLKEQIEALKVVAKAARRKRAPKSIST
jgi:hypothetical protein